MKNVPKLRFKGFSDEWEERKLEDVSDVRDGTHDSPKYIEKGYPLVTSKNLGINGKLNFDNINFISKEDYININKRSKVDKGDILFGMIGTIGNPVIVDQDGFAIKNVALIKELSSVKNRYLIQMLNSNFIYKQFYRENSGGTQKFIALGNIRNLNIQVPSLEEQEKIANFLTKVDKFIEKQEEKVNNLEQYKKGMLQKIFSQEIRFKKDDGREYPEWKEKKINDIANLTSSKRIFLSDYVNSGIPFYRGKEITELKSNKIPTDILYITEEKYKEIKESYGVPKIGDILLTAVGTLGNSYLINNEDPFYFKDGNLIWFKEISVNSNFLDLYLSSPQGQKKILDSSIGSTQKALTIVGLNKLKIDVPILEEQTKIANFLSKIYSTLDKEKEKLEELRRWKKGLLQQMFV